MERNGKQDRKEYPMIYPENGVRFHRYTEDLLNDPSRSGKRISMILPSRKKYLKSMRIASGKGITLYILSTAWLTVDCDNLTISFDELLKANFKKPGEDIDPVGMSVAVRYALAAVNDLVNTKSDNSNFEYPAGWDKGLQNVKFNDGKAVFSCDGPVGVIQSCDILYDFVD